MMIMLPLLLLICRSAVICIAGPIGPPVTRVHRQQAVTLYFTGDTGSVSANRGGEVRLSRVVLQGSTVTPDAPYSSYFHMVDIIELSSSSAAAAGPGAPSPRSRMAVQMAPRFLKSTMFSGQIISKSIEGGRLVYGLWDKLIRVCIRCWCCRCWCWCCC